MPRELLLLRHGKSDWSTGDDDVDRPLKDRGKRGAQRIGVWLAARDLLPNHIVSSPAERALTTAEKACKAMGMGVATIANDDRVYDADLADLLAVLAACPTDSRRVLLVGHNPGLEDLLLFLVPETALPADDNLLPTATLARLDMPADWRRLRAGCARLENLIKPRRLPKTFPFPDAHGTERRLRPAYYYRQSSVVPYRLRDGKVEILIVSSSKRKHWVVPKGIREPGLSPQDSAACEAREEAGIEGQIGGTPVGSYRYEKWGATCTVQVFAMLVKRVLPEEQWEERHRGRRWVSPEEACSLLRQTELGPLVKKLAESVRSS